MQIVDARFEPCTQRLRDPGWKFARAAFGRFLQQESARSGTLVKTLGIRWE